jgi:hypothetical protein
LLGCDGRQIQYLRNKEGEHKESEGRSSRFWSCISD